MRKFVFGFLSLAMAAVAVSCGPAFGVYDPRCEGLEEPLGIDSSVPRFSWKIRSKEPMTQVAYEIQVASSIKALESGDPDLWSSGRVSSQEQVMIPYDGTSLSSRQQCWWRVRVWRSGEEASRWSSPQRFGVGIIGGDCLKGDYIDATFITDSSPLVRKHTFHLETV